MNDRVGWQTMAADIATAQVVLARLPPGQRTSRDHLRIAIERSSAQEDVPSIPMKPLLGCKGLWVYRFEIPSGEFFRFRLSWSSAPVVRSSAARRLLDFAYRRVSERGICSKHLRPHRAEAEEADDSELHLGEADYLALLSNGRCACADDDDAGDISRPFDKTGRQAAESRDGGAGESVEIVRVRNKRTTENGSGIESYCPLSTPKTDADQKRSDDTHREEPADEFPSPVRQALQVLLTQRAPVVRVSKPTNALGRFDPGREVKPVEVWTDSEDSASRDKVPQNSVKLQDPGGELATGVSSVNYTSKPAFKCNDSQEVQGLPASSSAAAGAPAAGGEDVNVSRALTGVDVVSCERNDNVLEAFSFEKCRREPVRANQMNNVLFAVAEDERVFVLSSASERLKSALTFPSHPLATDLIAELMQLVFDCESFLKAGSIEPEDPAAIRYSNTLTSEESDAERPDPDQPDSIPDQFTIENEFRRSILFHEVSVRSKERSRCHGVTPADFAFGFEEITLRSDSPSPPPPATASIAAAQPPRPSVTAAAVDDDDSAWSDRRRCSPAAAAAAAAAATGTLWERSRRAIGRFLRAVGRFFRDRFRMGLRRPRRRGGRLSLSDLKVLGSRPMAEDDDGRV